MEETRVPRENHRPVSSQWQTLSHNVVSSTPRHVVVIGTDCTCSCKSNYYTITTTTAPFIILEDYEENIFQFDMVINFQLLVQYSLYDLLHMWKILEYHKTPPTFRKLLTNIIVEGYIEYTSSYSGIKLTIVLIVTGWKLNYNMIACPSNLNLFRKEKAIPGILI